MILPSKHIRTKESLLALGGLVLAHLDSPKTLDAVWEGIEPPDQTGEHVQHYDFDTLVLAVDFLFSIGAIRTSPTGELSIATDSAEGK